MSKKNEYTDAMHEQDSEKVMHHINNQSNNIEEARQSKKEKERQTKIGRYALRFCATALTIWALYHAKTAGLIAPVIVTPATYVGFTYLGWCLCKVVGLSKKN